MNSKVLKVVLDLLLVKIVYISYTVLCNILRVWQTCVDFTWDLLHCILLTYAVALTLKTLPVYLDVEQNLGIH